MGKGLHLSCSFRGSREKLLASIPRRWIRAWCLCLEADKSGAGLGPAYAEFQNDPDVTNFCKWRYKGLHP